MADPESDAHVLSRVLKPVNLRRADIQIDEILDPKMHTSLSSVTANLISGAIPAPKGYVVMYCQKLSDYVLLYTNKSKSTALMHFGLLECGSSDEEAVPVGYSKPMWNHVEPPMSLAQLEVPIEKGRERSRSPHVERTKNKRAEKEKWLPDEQWKPQRQPVDGYPGYFRVPTGGELEYITAKEGEVMWAKWAHPESASKAKYYRIRAGDRVWTEYHGEDELEDDK